MTARSYEPDKQMFNLAKEAGIPSDALQQLYTETVRELSTDARIADYLHVLACRRLKAALANGPLQHRA